MNLTSSAIVRGRAGHLLVPAVIIALCAVGAPLYYRRVLPDFCAQNAAKVLATVAAVEALLLACAAFLAGRRMILHGPKLLCCSWFSRREIDVGAISDLSLQTDYSSDSISTSFLVLWGAAGPLLRINPAVWERKALAAMLQRLLELNPQIQVAREVRPYVSR